MLTGVVVSALLIAMYAQGGPAWGLAFVAWIPWLTQLDARARWRDAFLAGYLMSVAYCAAAFAWFGLAVGEYTGGGPLGGLLALLLGAPLFQPQILAYALVRHAAQRRQPNRANTLWVALAGPSAWVATEALVPKMLGDTWAHGLYPATYLRQAADIVGTAGLTWLALLTNEMLLTAWYRRGQTWRRWSRPLAGAALWPTVLAVYGLWYLHQPVPQGGQTLRVGMVQANLVHYERMRQQMGAYPAVRQVLDTHYAMSYDAVVNHKADVVLWSETAYPTTLGHPKSATGAELDQELLSVVTAAGVPFVIGTYDLDDQGEYNAAAFIEPRTGVLGMYRKTRLFPMTESVPAWMDMALVQRWLPWVGQWQPGNGARVFPLRLRDGKEIPVLPLICLDDVDTRLALDGARLGAQAIVTLSNDSWFTPYPQGMALHHAAAAFRSIETRLPQLRLTTNGYSAVIRPDGDVTAGSKADERTLVIGDIVAQEVEPTWMVKWGDWFGLACIALLGTLACAGLAPQWLRWTNRSTMQAPLTFPVSVVAMPIAARWAAGILHAAARIGLLVLGMLLLLNDAWRAQSLLQIRLFAGMVVLPEVAGWLVLQGFKAKLSFEGGHLVLQRGQHVTKWALSQLTDVRIWRVPVPGPGVHLRFIDEPGSVLSLRISEPLGLIKALRAQGVQGPSDAATGRNWLTYIAARTSVPRRWLDQPLVKFGALPLALSMPAFRMHQYIAYGSGVGEWQTFGAKAYLTTLLIWWAAWTIGVMLCAAGVRACIEAGTVISIIVRPRAASQARAWLERIGLALLYIGLPTWLLTRMLHG